MLMKIRSQMQRTNNQKGFTLVELMVVVVIIGVLIAIAVPVYNNVTASANRSAVEANLRTIDGAIMQYQAVNNGSSPGNTTDGKGGDLMKTGSKYLQEWPSGPDKVVYDINDGRAIVSKTTGDGGTGPWFDLSETTNGSGFSLPITWKD